MTSAKATEQIQDFRVGRHVRVPLVKLKERSLRWFQSIDRRHDRVTITHDGKAIGILLTMDDYRDLARRELGY